MSESAGTVSFHPSSNPNSIGSFSTMPSPSPELRVRQDHPTSLQTGGIFHGHRNLPPADAGHVQQEGTGGMGKGL